MKYGERSQWGQGDAFCNVFLGRRWQQDVLWDKGNPVLAG